jgi:hypothetical protein
LRIRAIGVDLRFGGHTIPFCFDSSRRANGETRIFRVSG